LAQTFVSPTQQRAQVAIPRDGPDPAQYMDAKTARLPKRPGGLVLRSYELAPTRTSARRACRQHWRVWHHHAASRAQHHVQGWLVGATASPRVGHAHNSEMRQRGTTASTLQHMSQSYPRAKMDLNRPATKTKRRTHKTPNVHRQHQSAAWRYNAALAVHGTTACAGASAPVPWQLPGQWAPVPQHHQLSAGQCRCPAC
jgi:hypothetical protein